MSTPPERDVYSVSRLNREARELLEDAFATLWIEGEISNLARPRSGHLYFSLKDERAQVRCAMFRMRNRLLDFEPQNGAQVLLRGRVSLYQERGEFQLVADYLELAGAGALRRAFDALRLRLAEEGLFAPDTKRALPAMPRTIGVVTSPSGAAIRDVLNVLARRYPGIPVILYPTRVQGDGAEREIAAMIARADRRSECDVLLVVRGGGSLEDLWAFNEEVSARAIHACRIPVVTGIGHEIDFTIADFVADVRAPTPSAAAELATPDAREMAERIGRAALRIASRSRALFANRRRSVAATFRRLRHPRTELARRAQRTDEIGARLARATRSVVTVRRGRLAGWAQRLAGANPALELARARARGRSLRERLAYRYERRLAAGRARLSELDRALQAVSPQRTLERGYAVVTALPSGGVLRDSDAVGPGARVRARLARGTLECAVESIEPPE